MQTVWFALLTLVWLAFCSPWPSGTNALLAAGVAVAATTAVVVLTRRLRARRVSTAHALAGLDGIIGTLPTGMKRHMPMVITVGDPVATSGAWGNDSVRVTDTAIWVRCESPAALEHLAGALKCWRGGQGPDAVVMLVAADGGWAEDDTAMVWKPWHSALGVACRALGYTLPLGVAVYAVSGQDEDEEMPWFGVSGDAPLDTGRLSAIVTPQLRAYARAAVPISPEERARRAALLDALVRWTSGSFLPMWTKGRPPWRVMAFGVAMVPGPPALDAPFGRFVEQVTGLTASPAAWPEPSRCILPEALLAGIPRQPARHPWAPAFGHAAIGLTAFFAAGATASAVQNDGLVRRVADHAARYRALDPVNDAARADALAALRRDRDELERHANGGVPLRLGFGLYRGAPWLPVIDDLVASYRPPAAPPSTIELDSMALFQSGSAVLNPGSNRVLVGALEMIKAHSGKRVLVAGYTDSTGRSSANQRLSEARAAAVRDWLIDASGLSATRFATQGYGDTRPKVSNDTAAGRAINRRVTITLIPDCRDDDGSRSTEGLPACSQ